MCPLGLNVCSVHHISHGFKVKVMNACACALMVDDDDMLVVGCGWHRWIHQNMNDEADLELDADER